MSDERAICSRNKLREDVIQILKNGKLEDIFSEMDTCQNTIDLLSDEEVNEKLAVSTKYDSLKKIHFDNRSKLIERIPDFWMTAIGNHPDLSQLIDNDHVRDIFRYVTKMNMDLFKGGHLKVEVFFRENPYIENEVLIKEFTVGENEEKMSKTTDIVWKQNLSSDQERPLGSRKRRLDGEQHFFDWFAKGSTNYDFTSTQFYAIWETPTICYMMGKIDYSDVEEEEMDQSEESDKEY